MPTYTFPYRDAFGQGFRPYLALHLTSPVGKRGSLFGLIDSGADLSCLPFGYAALMGYSGSDLEAKHGQQASGMMTIHRAKRPCRAYVVGLPELPFDLCPVFVENSQTPLWGRADFFRAFGVAFNEDGQEFTLSR